MPEPGSNAAARTRGELIRYLAVGGWNTLFGYACFAGLTALFADRIPEGYIVASLFSNIISVTVSFRGYKWFVFRTTGNYFREWLRCLSVYSVSIVFSAIALPVIVHLLRRNPKFAASAPYIAGAIIIGLSAGLSFFGHKYYSFRPAPDRRVEQARID
jgi:putative flippase GtrA